MYGSVCVPIRSGLVIPRQYRPACVSARSGIFAIRVYKEQCLIYRLSAGGCFYHKGFLSWTPPRSQNVSGAYLAARPVLFRREIYKSSKSVPRYFSMAFLEKTHLRSLGSLMPPGTVPASARSRNRRSVRHKSLATSFRESVFCSFVLMFCCICFTAVISCFYLKLLDFKLNLCYTMSS